MERFSTDREIKVLIIEDSKTYALILEKALQRGGLQPHCEVVETIKNILHQIRTNRPDLILCDYTLPDMNGLDAYEAVKAAGEDIPFIIVSGTISEETAITMMEAGVHDYIMKDNTSRLIPVIRRELKNAEARAQKRIAEEELKMLNENLEKAVSERTKMLEETNKKLLEEINKSIELNKSLSDTRSFMDAILENMPVTVYAKDPGDLTFQFINKTGEEFMGLKREELIGKRVEELLPRNYSYVFTNSDDKLLNGEIEMDTRKITDDFLGKGICELVSKKILIKDENENPRHIVGIVEDHTEIRKAEYERRKTEKMFARLFEQSPVAIIAADDKTGKVRDVNDSFLNLFELDRNDVEDALLKNLTLWLNEKSLDDILKAVKKHGSISGREQVLLTKNGFRKEVIMSAEYIDFQDEKRLFFLMLDITSKKEADREKENAIRTELELSELKSKLISMISHEFRTPLTTIMLAADMLKRYGKEWDTDTKNKHFDRIQDTVLGMIKIIENVLTIGRFESGKYKFSPERTDLPAFCKSVVDSIKFQKKTDTAVECKYLGGCTEVFIDENLLGLILSNLLHNSLKYNRNNNPVRLNVFCHSGEAFFEVKDKGIGIPQEEIRSIYETFFRGSNVGTISGYGLGMNIVRRSVDSHMGSIFVESILNVGTKVTVVLPVKQEEDDEAVNSPHYEKAEAC